MKKSILKRVLAVLMTVAMCAAMFSAAPVTSGSADVDEHYYREDPGLGQVPIAVATTTDNWKTRSRFDNRIPADFAGSTFEAIAYPFGDKESSSLLQINYIHNGKTTFGGISLQTSWNEGTVNVPSGSTLDFDLFYPKSAQGKYMRFRLQATNGTADTYIRELDYHNLNPDWIGSYMGETWLKTHISVSINAGSTSSFSIELHGENARPAEEGVLLLGNIQVLAPDPEGTPLPMVVNDENQSQVAPLKSKYNTENGSFMVGAIGVGNVNGTRARHYEIFVDGNNLKADSTHPTGPAWLVGTDGTQIGSTNATGSFSSEYRIPTSSYQAVRDSGEPGEYKVHGHVMAWYNQAPSWMTKIRPEHLESGYQGDVNFYGLGNGVSTTVPVDKDLAKRVQYNHIVNIMRHFLTTDERYGSSEARGIIPFNSWDILNEEVHESRHTETIPADENSWRTALKHTNWLVAMSDDDIDGDLSDHYVYLLFKYAHIAAPNAAMAEAYKANYDSLPEYMKLDNLDKDGSIDAYVLEETPLLTYNDYGTATRTKARTIYNMVRDLNTAWLSDPLYDGRPLIEVVGFQGHDSVGSTLASDNQYAMALCASLIDEGLLTSIAFSEFDLKLLTDAPGGGATAPAALNVRQSDALGYQYALLYKLFDKFALYIDHIMSWGVAGSGWQGSYVLFDGNSNANSGYYAAMDPVRFIKGHSYLDYYFDGEYEAVKYNTAVDLGDLGMYSPKLAEGKTDEEPPVAFEIVQQPSDIIVGNKHETFSFTVEATGDDVTYMWYYSLPSEVNEAGDRVFHKSGNATDTYTRTASATTDGIQVYCVVKSGDQKLTSCTATGTIGRATLEIISQPESVVGPKHTTAVFSFGVYGTKYENGERVANNDLSYNWYVKLAGEAEFRKGSKQVNYTRTIGTATDGMQVYCVVTDAFGNRVQSEIATLSIAPAEAD